ncbi:MAG: hypothetical protein HY000_31205 [Planctomycetes bacterium]|nr:hypothetical protein [Planctomycetota bacterium]
MQASKANDLAEELLMHGHRLCDVIPMGHLSGMKEVTSWSTRFGTQPPVLLVASDLDHACEYIEEAGVETRLVVVDGSGRNAGKAASLARLRCLDCPTLVVCGLEGMDEVAPAGNRRIDI